MFRSGWIAAITLGVTLFITSVFPYEDRAKSEPDRQTGQQETGDKNSKKPIRVFVISGASESSYAHYEAAASNSEEDSNNYLIGGDGVAQWVMAACSIVALFVSFWGVILLYRTIKASREAVDAANTATAITKAIGEAQTRAYLAVTSARYQFKRDSVSAILDIENIGNSPARDVEIFGYVIINETLGTSLHFRVTDSLNSDTTKTTCQPIMTKSKITEEIAFLRDYDFGTEDSSIDFRRSKLDLLRNGNEVSFAVTIRYTDVFNNVEDVPVILMQLSTRTPLARIKKKAEAGNWLFVSMTFLASNIPKTTTSNAKKLPSNKTSQF